MNLKIKDSMVHLTWTERQQANLFAKARSTTLLMNIQRAKLKKEECNVAKVKNMKKRKKDAAGDPNKEDQLVEDLNRKVKVKLEMKKWSLKKAPKIKGN